MAQDPEQVNLLESDIKTTKFSLTTREHVDDDPTFFTQCTAEDMVHAAEDLLLDALTEISALEGQKREQARLHLYVGLLLEQRLGDPRRAVLHYQTAQDLAPENLAIIQVLRRVFWSKRNWFQVLKLLDQELALVSDPRRSSFLHLYRGRIFEGYLMQFEAAMDAYQQVLLKDPTNRMAQNHLRQLLRQLEEPQLLVDYFHQSIASMTDSRIKGLFLMEIAHTLDEEHSGSNEALSYYQKTLETDPTLSAARGMLKRSLYLHQRFKELGDLLITEAEEAKDDVGRAMILNEAARILQFTPKEQKRRAELLSNIRQIMPTDPALLYSLSESFAVLGQFQQQVDVLQDLLKCIDEPPLLAAIYYKLGHLFQERFQQTYEAASYFQKAVEEQPEHQLALETLCNLYLREKRYEAYVDVVLRAADRLHDRELCASLFCRCADICHGFLSDPLRAKELYFRALQALPGFWRALRSLELFLESEGDWEGLVSLLEEQLSKGEGVEQRELCELLGHLYDEKLQNGDRALLYYEQARELRESPVPLLRQVQKLVFKLARWELLVETLDQETLHVDDPRHAVMLMHQAAETCEVLIGDLTQAESRYIDILRRFPGYHPSFHALKGLYFRQGRWDLALELIRSQLGSEDIEAEDRGVMLHQEGELYLLYLDDEEAALSAFERAQMHTRGTFSTLEWLAYLYKKREAWEKLAEVYHKLASSTKSPELSASLWHSVGEIYELRCPNTEQSILAYREAVKLKAGLSPSIQSLFRVFLKEQRYGDVVELLDDVRQARIEERSKGDLLKQMGMIYEQKLYNAQGAVLCFEHALDLIPDDLEALEALSRLYLQIEDHASLVEVYHRFAQHAKEPIEAVQYLYEAASIIESYFHDQDVTHFYEEVLRLIPDEPMAFESLCRIFGERAEVAELARIIDTHYLTVEEIETRRVLLFQLGGFREAQQDPEGAAHAFSEANSLDQDWIVTRELRRVQEKLNNWGGIVENLELEASLCHSPALIVQSLKWAAELYREKFDDSEREKAILEVILEADPFQEEAMARLEHLLLQSKAYKEFAGILRRRLELIAQSQNSDLRTVEIQLNLLNKLARLYVEYLDDPRAAIEAFNRSRQLDPNHLPTLNTLGDLYIKLELFPEAVEVFNRVVSVSSDPDTLRMAQSKLGDIYGEKLNEHRQAVSCYQNVLALMPQDTSTMRKLVDLFYQHQDIDNAADTLARLIEIETDSQALVSHHLQLAEIFEKHFLDPYLAATEYQHALAIEMTDEKVLLHITQLYLQLEDWESLVRTIRSFLAALPQDQESRGLPFRMQLAAILKEKLGRLNEALEQYRIAVEIDPTNTPARFAAAKVLLEQGKLEEAIAEHRVIQEIETINVESLKEMRTLWSRLGLLDLSHRASSLLSYVNQTGEVQDNLYREKLGKAPRDGLLDETQFVEIIVHPEESVLGNRILRVLCEIGHRLRLSHTSKFKVNKSERLPFRSDDPLRGIVREVALALGLEREVEVYVTGAQAKSIDLLLSDPPALIVGNAVMNNLRLLEIRFRIGQMLSYLKNQTWVAYDLNAEELKVLIFAACRVVNPHVNIRTTAEPDLAEAMRLIQRHISRRSRRDLEDAVQGFISGPEPNFEEWCRAMQKTALRTGLLVTNNIEAALHYLARFEPSMAHHAGADNILTWLKESNLTADLIHLWLSEELDSLLKYLTRTSGEQ